MMPDKPMRAPCGAQLAVISWLVLLWLTLAISAAPPPSPLEQAATRLELSIEARELRAIALLGAAPGSEPYNRALNETLPVDPRAFLSTNRMPIIRRTVAMTYHQCVFHSQRWLRVRPSPKRTIDTGSGRHPLLVGTFVGTDARPVSIDPLASTWLENPSVRQQQASGEETSVDRSSTAGALMTRNCSATQNPCALYYQDDPEALFNGLDKIILIGDSTFGRLYSFLGATAAHGKIADAKPYQNFVKTLRSGRKVEVHMFVMMYAANLQSVAARAFRIATVKTMILITLGAHDVKWLTHRKDFIPNVTMPTMVLAEAVDQQTGTVRSRAAMERENAKRANAYWERWAANAADVIGEQLQAFEQRERSRAVGGRPRGILRPFVAFRDRLMPKCSDPRFSVRRAWFRCETILKLDMIPTMRQYLRAQMLLINVPTIGVDALTHGTTLPCYSVDYIHLSPSCKMVEWQLAVVAYRLARRIQLTQGFPAARTSSPYGEPPQARRLLQDDGVQWVHLARHLSHLRPRGVLHPNTVVQANPQLYQYDSLYIPRPEAFADDEWSLFREFGRSTKVAGSPVELRPDVAPAPRADESLGGGPVSRGRAGHSVGALIGDMRPRSPAGGSQLPSALMCLGFPMVAIVLWRGVHHFG